MSTDPDPDQYRAALVRLFRDIAGDLETFPDEAFTNTGGSDVDRQAMRVLFDMAGPLSLMTGGMAMTHKFPDRLNGLGDRTTRSGLHQLANAPMLRHLSDCPEHQETPR